ncbi:MAG: hypothetical protein OHK0029_31870 [Armatimonadaceae bacterium]
MASSTKTKKKAEKGDVGAVIKQLVEEVRSLKSEIGALRQENQGESAIPSAKSPAVSAISHLLENHEVGDEAGEAVPVIPVLPPIEDAEVARLGYAFSSVPKVALLRHLLSTPECSAAELGEKAGLTTGSLYHHLRELVHSGAICQPEKRRYSLTDSGRRLLLRLYQETDRAVPLSSS